MKVSIESGKISITENWDPVEEPVPARSTPNTAFLTLGGHYQSYGSPSRHYQWGVMTHITNTETAPLTNISAVAQGYAIRGMDATTRQIGSGGEAHSIEIISGQENAQGIFELDGTAVLRFVESTYRGSRFCVGDAPVHPAIPTGTIVESIIYKDDTNRSGSEVVSIEVESPGSGYEKGELVQFQEGDPEAPCIAKIDEVTPSGGIWRLLVVDPGSFKATQTNTHEIVSGSGQGATVSVEYGILGVGEPVGLVLNNSVTTSTTDEITFLPSVDNNNIGLLITGSGNGGTDQKGNKKGKAITVQAYGEAAYQTILQISKTGLRADGNAITLYGTQANPFACGRFVHIVDGEASEALIEAKRLVARNFLRVEESNSFTDSFMHIDGQTISTGSQGIKIGETSDNKLGFFGQTPTTQPTTPTTLPELIAALQQLGLLA